VRETRAFACRHAATDALGAFGHPSGGSATYHATAPDGASHRIVSLTWQGDALEGVLEALPTAPGAALVAALVAGACLGVSTRGWGQLQAAEGGAAVLVGDFQLAAFDVVLQPATLGATLAPLAAREAAAGGAPGVRLHE